MADHLMEYGPQPICPRCGYDQFDDWWHSLKPDRGWQPRGRLPCGKCQKTFTIQGQPGNLYSSCYGVRNA